MKPRVFLPAIVSAAVLWAAFFPLDLGPLAFVALVPWLTLVRAPVSKPRRYFAAYLGGVAFFGIACQWIRVAHPMMYLSWLGLSVVYPLSWVLALWLIRRLDRLGLPLAVSVSVVWVALEFARAHFPTGFPFLSHIGLYQMIGFGWYFLGYTQHDFLPFIQIADLGGVYAVSFVIAAVNGAAADWLFRSTIVRGWLRWEPEAMRLLPISLLPTSIAVVAMGIASVCYGFVQLDHPAYAPGPRVALVQGSVPQFQKNQKGRSLGEAYGPLHIEAMNQVPPPDLIVWPETCFPMDWAEAAPGSEPSAEFRREIEHTAKEFHGTRPGSATLLGLNGLVWEGDRAWKYNSALLIDTRGQKLGRYDKMHLVPFGEYVPLKETFPWMSTFTPYKWDYSCKPGELWTRFPLTANDGRMFTFGCLICYEDSDPYLARQYAGATEPVDFLVNISNDGWFDGTEEHEQHLAICRFRAIETRRSVVRAVNMGISATIDPDGRVIALPGETWSTSKKVEGVVTAVVPIGDRITWFARLGDWLPGVCWGLIGLGFVASTIRNRRG